MSLQKRLDVVVGMEMTPGELAEISRKRYVGFAPHVGNKFLPSDVSILKIGEVQAAVVERNQSVRDVFERPEVLILGGEIHDLVGENDRVEAKMSPYLEFDVEALKNEVVRHVIEVFGAKTPAHLHQVSFKKKVGDELVKTQSERYFLGEENVMIRGIVEMLHEYFLNGNVEDRIFNRYVNGEGEVFRSFEDLSRFKSKSGEIYIDAEVQKDEFVGKYWDFLVKLADSCNLGEIMKGKEGPILRNEFMVLLHVLKPMMVAMKNGGIEVSDDGVFDAYCVSGQSMFNYASEVKFIEVLSKYYDVVVKCVKERFGIELPEKVRLHFVPGSSLEVLPFEDEARMLKLVGEYFEKKVAIEKLQWVQKSGGRVNGADFKRLSAECQVLVPEMREIYKRRGRVTQYDERKVVFPDWFMEVKFGVYNKLCQILEK